MRVLLAAISLELQGFGISGWQTGASVTTCSEHHFVLHTAQVFRKIVTRQQTEKQAHGCAEAVQDAAWGSQLLLL